MTTTRLGVFELLVLMAVGSHRGAGYGVTIRQAVAAARGTDVSSGAVHTTLDRLEQRSLIGSRTGETSPARGGRPRRYYRLTRAGELAVEANYAALKLMARRMTPKVTAS
jgi:DNA-binding PadR family transcriptional regulator